jgi:hypothetical protein
LFEKRYIIFIENGVDLKLDCNCFGEDYKSQMNTIPIKTIQATNPSVAGTSRQGTI